MKLLFSKMLLLTLAASVVFTGCASRNKTEISKIAIAEQFGLAYAPLQLMKEMKLLEKNLPGIEVGWKQLGNTTAIREAMLAGEIDAGFMAIPPFLIGWDKGMEWKIACGLSACPVDLVTNRDDIKSIEDFSKNDRIALPQPGSVQHILLSMACEKVFGDSHRLDDQLVTLAHPDGMNALLSGTEITAHFTAPPYLFKELEVKGVHRILEGKEAMGTDFTFIVGVTSNKFYNDSPKVYKAFIKSIKEAVEFIEAEPEKAASMLAVVYDMDKEELLKYLTWDGMGYGLSIKGLSEFSNFMKRNGYISRIPERMSDVFLEDADYEK